MSRNIRLQGIAPLIAAAVGGATAFAALALALPESSGRPALLVASGVALVVPLALAWRLRRRWTANLAVLTEGIDRLAVGDFEHRVDERLDLEVFERMARALNQTAALAQSQISAVEAARSHSEAVVDSMSEGVLVTDHRGRARIANPAFRHIFDFAGRADGRSPLELTHEPRFEDFVNRTLESGEPQVEEMDHESTPPQALVLAGSPLSDGSGAVIVVRNVTDLVRLNRMRRDFVANVSHELKTPLTAIRGFAETLRDGAVEDPKIAARFVDRIIGQSVRLQALLDDLLTLSRLESPSATAERQLVDMVGLVRSSLEQVQPLAREKGIELTSELAADCALGGEPESLERMVRNLLENAIRYNRSGGRVTAQLDKVESEIHLTIRDTGVGIPAGDLARVFERFYRVDQARSREEGGTGLGLAIVKHAAQLHGGSVEVESELGQGSVFRVRLARLGAPVPKSPVATL